MSFREFTKSLGRKESVEGELFTTIFISLITSFVVLSILYFAKFRFIENFLSRYGFYLFFSVLSYALICGVLKHVRAFGQFPCMSGMMIGMTTGMIAGFLPGFFVAATNGMFVGVIFGMLIGISIGIYCGGCCCGVMGFLEGMMAGFMGGLMGAMTAFMLLNDHLRASTVVVFLVSVVILGALNYMLYLEGKQLERRRKEGNFFTVALTFVLIVLTTWLIVFGPRTGALAG